jgi:ABC-type transport system involved in multi-copper enzyme maturation permease subunit
MKKSIFPLAFLTLKDGLRHRMLHGIGLFALLMTGVTILTPSLFMYDLGKVAIDIGLTTTTVSGLFVIFFLGMNILGKDLDKKTIYMVLAQPTSRAQYVLGKYLGVCLLLLVSFIFLSALLWLAISMAHTFMPQHFMTRFSWPILLYAQLFILLELIMIASVVFFFMSVCSSFYIAIILSFCVYLIGTGIESVEIALTNNEVQTSNSIIAIINCAKWIIPNLSAFDFKTNAAYGLPIKENIIFTTFFYWLFYNTIILLGTIFFFKKKDLL